MLFVAFDRNRCAFIDECRRVLPDRYVQDLWKKGEIDPTRDVYTIAKYYNWDKKRMRREEILSESKEKEVRIPVAG